MTRSNAPHYFLALATALLLIGVVVAPARAADELPRLAEPVTDQAGALSPTDERRITAALAELRADHGVQLFVAFVDTTGSASATGYTAALAESASLGGNDALLVVAVEDRSDALWLGSSLDAVTDDEIDSVLSEAVEPVLADGDFAGAMLAGIEALGRVVTSPAVTPVPATPVAATPAAGAGGTGTDAAGTGGGLDLTPILGILLVAGGILLVGWTLWRRRAASRAQAVTLDALNHDANKALLDTDEALKDAGDDVDFAAAQWGDEEVVPYRDAIRQASDELRAAFAIRQRLDDADPETQQERDVMLREIVTRCTRAQDLLDAQEQRFDQLRDLEAAAPAQLAALPQAIDALTTRRAAAKAIAARLTATYAPSATASVDGNLEEAAKALDTASAEAGRGASVVGTKPAAGVVALRRAQEAMAGATRLVEGVERLAASLDDAAARLPGELDAAAKDVVAARQAVGRISQLAGLPPAPGSSVASGSAADYGVAVREAEEALGAARRAAEARPLDPLAAFERASAANQAADAIIATVAGAETQVARRRQVAEAAVASAQGRVTRAVDFITTRRHGVGETARTRAAEAEVRLGEARTLVSSDPETATATANRASQLADEAYRLASGEFDQWNRGSGPVAGPNHAGSSPGSQVPVAILGGLIGAVLSGAAGANRGQGGSGWGGSPWGGAPRSGPPTGGFGLPPGRGRTRGGGFSLPSGGSRGGGGGRVRGGRW